jgi:hypothetical protein
MPLNDPLFHVVFRNNTRLTEFSARAAVDGNRTYRAVSFQVIIDGIDHQKQTAGTHSISAVDPNSRKYALPVRKRHATIFAMFGVGRKAARKVRLLPMIVGNDKMIDPIHKPRPGFMQQSISQPCD